MYRRHRYPEMLYGTREARRCNILCDDLDQYEYMEECRIMLRRMRMSRRLILLIVLSVYRIRSVWNLRKVYSSPGEEQTVETADGRFYHTNRTWEKTDTIYFDSPSRNIGISAICDSIYNCELQKSGKHMNNSKEEIKLRKNH